MKKILILYVDNGGMKSVYQKELMWSRVLGWISEGRSRDEIDQTEVSFSRAKKSAEFTDGTTVEMLPIGLYRGMRFTHIFISDEVLNLPNGYRYVIEGLMPMIVHKNHNYLNTEGKDMLERLFIFKVNDNNKLELNEFNSL